MYCCSTSGISILNFSIKLAFYTIFFQNMLNLFVGGPLFINIFLGGLLLLWKPLGGLLFIKWSLCGMTGGPLGGSVGGLLGGPFPYHLSGGPSLRGLLSGPLMGNPYCLLKGLSKTEPL